jgi:lipoprotein Spr/probable lipoprotein NlpC
MKTKLIMMSNLLVIIAMLGTSCFSTQPVSKNEFYAIYSQKLGVKLNGNEDLNLLESMVSWKGTPYRYGGNTKKGTDCSGFVTSVYKEVYGKQLQRSSKDIVKDVKYISKNEMKAGDILFFKINGKSISHVGIYIADNKFIHASTKSGVVVNDLSQEYYQKAFYKAGRVKR